MVADTGKALLEEFRLSCEDWVDRNDHAIVKYIFKSAYMSNISDR